VMYPLCLTLFVFGPSLLGLWLGPAFAEAAGVALRILAVGIFLAGLAMLPLALLYGAGRPDLPAKINVLQVALHIPITVVLVRALGLSGGALAMAILRTEEVVFYEWATRRYVGRPARDMAARSREYALIVLAAALALAFAVAASLRSSAPLLIGIASLACALYAAAAWVWVLRPAERQAWIGMLRR
jgi:O-antigen/teichoic acid export membrane protein